ncbi:PQQ-binding-like beta-propeller repeat protein [Gordonia sp. ABSL1-1]|uniref:outer membrane protein assembly factor BamB family protein n=1 Tax=Gordonia sp. ABSL1-1 TaxID=3053923 RepID=UPI0025726D89|nr:PQQ-binding-like beta-propeller repeat protein [Gordonia sp. ABSL1-1]MDL9937778.1 PQQ-binding-like beta-propeller repeat protein [Gordonia sp. ABSL1-1]
MSHSGADGRDESPEDPSAPEADADNPTVIADRTDLPPSAPAPVTRIAPNEIPANQPPPQQFSTQPFSGPHYHPTQVGPPLTAMQTGPYPTGPYTGGPPTGPGVAFGPPQPPRPPRGQRAVPWVLAAIAVLCVVALTAGAIAWWSSQRDSADSDTADRQPLLPGQLTGTFPTAPGVAWAVTASDVGADQFVSPLPWDSQYLRVDALRDDTTVVTLAHTISAGARAMKVVGVDTTTGKHWTFDTGVASCADRIVDHLIACADTQRVYLIDVRSGATTDTIMLPGSGYGIAFNGDAVFTRTYSGSTLTITKLTPAGTVWTREITPPEALPSGDASNFTATDDLVASGGGTITVLAAGDGKTLLSEPGRSTIEALPDSSMLVVTGSAASGNPTDGPVVRVRADGTITRLGGSTVSSATVATPGQQYRALVGARYVDTGDGAELWSTTVGNNPRLVLADDREVVLLDNDTIRSVETATGRQIWSSTAANASPWDWNAVTDGETLIGPGRNGGLAALDLGTGAERWELPTADVGVETSATPKVFAAGDHLVAVTASAITGFAPTGPRAVVPGSMRAPATEESGGGGDEYVTPCGSPPVFTPQSFRTTSGGLGVTMKVSATCPGGDILYGPRTRISIAENGALVASGFFDFARAPVAVGSLESTGGLTMELTYPPGSFFRLPDTLTVDPGINRYLVDCDKGPTSGSPPKLKLPERGATAPAAVATGPSLPAGTDLSATSVSALRLQADSDRAFIVGNLNNRWVAQLSSKRPGLNAEGRIWDEPAILDEFLALRLRFNDVRLLYSDEWSVFSYKGWWVTVAAATFPGPDAANNWCRTQGFDSDHCFAKLISTTAGSEGSTRYW